MFKEKYVLFRPKKKEKTEKKKEHASKKRRTAVSSLLNGPSLTIHQEKKKKIHLHTWKYDVKRKLRDKLYSMYYLRLILSNKTAVSYFTS